MLSARNLDRQIGAAVFGSDIDDYKAARIYAIPTALQGRTLAVQ